jgi:ACR3 family arsenite transporter
MLLTRLGTGIRNNLGSCSAVAILSGLVVGHIYPLPFLTSFISVALFLMLYPSMLQIEIGEIGAAFKRPGILVVALLINFGLAPILIFGLVHLFYINIEASLMIGVMLFGMVPCGGMVPAYTGMLGGNVSLSVSITATSLALSIGMVPLWARLLIGRIVPVPTSLVAEYLVLAIVVPMALASVTRGWMIARTGSAYFEKMKDYLQMLPGYGLMFLLFIIFSVTEHRVVSSPSLFLQIVGPTSCFLLILLIFSTCLNIWLGLRYQDAVALTVSSGAKNNAVAIAVAAASFGVETASVIAIVGPLVQLPIMLGYIKVTQTVRKRVLQHKESFNR